MQRALFAKVRRAPPPTLGPSINYVISVGGRGSPKDDLLHRPYFYKKDDKGGGGQKLPILRRHSLWTAPKGFLQLLLVSAVKYLGAI